MRRMGKTTMAGRASRVALATLMVGGLTSGLSAATPHATAAAAPPSTAPAVVTGQHGGMPLLQALLSSPEGRKLLRGGLDAATLTRLEHTYKAGKPVNLLAPPARGASRRPASPPGGALRRGPRRAPVADARRLRAARGDRGAPRRARPGARAGGQPWRRAHGRLRHYPARHHRRRPHPHRGRDGAARRGERACARAGPRGLAASRARRRCRDRRRGLSSRRGDGGDGASVPWRGLPPGHRRRG